MGVGRCSGGGDGSDGAQISIKQLVITATFEATKVHQEHESTNAEADLQITWLEHMGAPDTAGSMEKNTLHLMVFLTSGVI